MKRQKLSSEHYNFSEGRIQGFHDQRFEIILKPSEIKILNDRFPNVDISKAIAAIIRKSAKKDLKTRELEQANIDMAQLRVINQRLKREVASLKAMNTHLIEGLDRLGYKLEAEN